MKYQLVKFNNGNYGIKKSFLFFTPVYLAIKDQTFRYWLTKKSNLFLKGYCEASKEEATEIYNRLTNSETVVLPKENQNEVKEVRCTYHCCSHGNAHLGWKYLPIYPKLQQTYTKLFKAGSNLQGTNTTNHQAKHHCCSTTSNCCASNKQ